MKIKKGDTVVVITGKDKGKTGKVLEVFPKTERVLVDGVNIVSRHTKPRSAQDKGGIIEKASPIHVSNVMIFENGKATRVAYKMIDGKKVRVSKKTGNSLDKEFAKAVKKQAKAEKETKTAEKVEKPTAKTIEKVEKTVTKTAKPVAKETKTPKTAEKPATTKKTTATKAVKEEKVEVKKPAAKKTTAKADK